MIRLLVALLLSVAMAGLPGCGTPDPQGSLGASQSEDLASRFRETVVPVLDARCGSCHAIRPWETESEIRPRLGWSSDEAGKLSSRELAEACRRRLVGETIRRGKPFAALDRAGHPLESPLLRAPLAGAWSGVPVEGAHPEIFADPEDPDFRKLRIWVEAELAGDGVRPLELESPAERYFAEAATPVLVRRGCFAASCHGSRSPGILLFRLDPGLAAVPGRFTPRIHRRNRTEVLGVFTRLINPHGDPDESNQLKKCIPLSEGGLVHRAGNEFLRKGDPDYRILRRWIELEQEELRQRTGAPLGETRGIVFVRRPRASPERFFEDGDFLPGGDLWWRRPDGREQNLTAHLHPHGPVDIRAPDVSYDASRVVFSMRRAADQPADLWEVELATGKARQLTFSDRPGVSYLDPLYVPDPDDAAGGDLGRVAIVMVSNREGERCVSSPAWILGEAESGTRESIFDRQRTEAPPGLAGREIEILRGAGKGYRGRIRLHEARRLHLDPPAGVPLDSTTTYMVRGEPRWADKFDAYRMRHAPAGSERATFETTLKRLTYSPSQVRRPTMRSSGRYVYTALRTGWQGGLPYFQGGLWRSHLDGCDFKQHNGNRSVVPIHADDRELPDGMEARIGRDSESFWGGALLLSDFRVGPPIETDNPYDDLDHPFSDVDHRSGATVHPFEPVANPSSLTRPIAGWISLDPQAEWGGRTVRSYRDPYPLPDGGLLVARTSGLTPFDLSDPEAAPDFDIVRVTPDPAWQSEYGHFREQGRLAAEERDLISRIVRPLEEMGFRRGRLRFETVVSGPESELWPRPVWVRAKEPVTRKLNPAVERYGPPAQVRGFEGYPEGTPAVVVNYDHLMIDHLGQSMIAAGVQHLAAARCPACGGGTAEDHQVTWVRIVGGRPGSQQSGSPESDDLERFMIGEVPLASDGSFYVEIPSGTPFHLQSLNPSRMAVRTSSRWRYLQPGEKHRMSMSRKLFPQACGACHGGMTGDPADARRRVDAVTRASPFEAGWVVAEGRPRDPLALPRTDAPQTVTFARDVAPLLSRRCVGCHRGPGPAGGVDLEGGTAREALLARIDTREFLSYRSFLVEKLAGRELGAERSLGSGAALDHPGRHHPSRPHPSEDPLTWDELLTLVRWIDLGAR